MRLLSRRRFSAAMLALGCAAAAPRPRARAAAPECHGFPGWASRLGADLEAMAARLDAHLKPWRGPKREARPEEFGHVSAQPLATRAIQAAIDALAAQGGGTVVLAQGSYVSGTLDLRSHIRLKVEQGAQLLGSLDLKDYPARIARRPTVMDSNMGMNQSLIFAEGCDNIALCGAGTIDGRGAKANFPGLETIGATPGRPFLIRIIDCQQVDIRDLLLKDSPCWMQNYLHCDDLLIENLRVQNQANFNNDGCDIDGCRRVIVRNCQINSEDDGLCFKGAAQRPTQDVLVENCRIYSTTNALKLGTDSQSVFRNVLLRKLQLGGPSQDAPAINRRRAESGISWEIVDGGRAQNIYARDIEIARADSPLFLRLGDRGRVRPGQPKPKPGVLRRIVYDRISGADNGARGSYFMGLPEKHIEDVALRDVALQVGATDRPVPAQQDLAEMRATYPDAHMVADAVPAYGLWARHVDGLTLTRVRFASRGRDVRPMILADLDTKRVCII
ncbi:MAG TPA: glycosyl hydrolase family 28 protein [Steroidobacteraceae bacterium]|nr:glycosyl hydrolase family 28 protein [Steroidobacteraceae bacterium]